MALDETDTKTGIPVYDESVPRYLTAFDPAFACATESDEAEFIKALLRMPLGVQEAGWGPYETTTRAVPAMQRLHALIPAGDEWNETPRHLFESPLRSSAAGLYLRQLLQIAMP